MKKSNSTSSNKLLRIFLIFLCLIIPIIILEFLSIMGIEHPAPLIILIGSSFLMFIIAVFPLNRMLISGMLLYFFTLGIWTLSQDLRTSDDLISYFKKMDINICVQASPSIKQKGLLILKAQYKNKKIKTMVIKKHYSTGRANFYCTKQKSQKIACFSNGFWTLSVLYSAPKGKIINTNINKPIKTQIDLILSKFILW